MKSAQAIAADEKVSKLERFCGTRKEFAHWMPPWHEQRDVILPSKLPFRNRKNAADSSYPFLGPVFRRSVRPQRDGAELIVEEWRRRREMKGKLPCLLGLFRTEATIEGTEEGSGRV